MQPRNTDENNVAIAGYDPVSYFQDKPTIGLAEITVEHDGAVYQFANDQNRATFLADPEKYAPQYGGWCAVAISENKTFPINPQTYSIEDGKLYLFYNGEHGNTKPQWEEAREERRANADQYWQQSNLELHHLET